MGFQVIDGATASAVVLHVPHSSTVVPPDVRAGLLLDDAALAAELRAMTDAATDLVAARASDRARLAPWRFVNRLSRLVVDPERFTQPGAEAMDAVGMGAVYTRTSQGGLLRRDDPDLRSDLLERFFTPYAEALADVVDDRLAAHGRAVLIDVHSYPRDVLPYEIHPTAPRPPVCLGIDVDHTPPWLLEAATDVFSGWGTAVDAPFIGTYVPTRHYRRDTRVSSLMVEIRRDLYLDGAGEPLPDRVAALGEALGSLVDRVAETRG